MAETLTPSPEMLSPELVAGIENMLNPDTVHTLRATQMDAAIRIGAAKAAEIGMSGILDAGGLSPILAVESEYLEAHTEATVRSYVSAVMSETDNPTLFARVVDTVKKYSFNEMDDEMWEDGNPSIGQKPGHERLLDERTALLEDLGVNTAEDEHTPTAEELKHIEEVGGRLKDARHALASALKRDKSMRQKAIDGKLSDTDGEVGAALAEFKAALAENAELYGALAYIQIEKGEMSPEEYEDILRGDDAQEGFIAEYQKVENLMGAMDYNETQEDVNIVKRGLRRIGNFVTRVAEKAHKNKAIMTVGTGLAVTGATIFSGGLAAGLAAGSIWGARRGFGHVGMKGTNSLIGSFFREQKYLTEEVLDKLSDGSVDIRSSDGIKGAVDEVENMIKALSKESTRDRKSRVIAASGAVTVGLATGGFVRNSLDAGYPARWAIYDNPWSDASETLETTVDTMDPPELIPGENWPEHEPGLPEAGQEWDWYHPEVVEDDPGIPREEAGPMADAETSPQDSDGSEADPSLEADSADEAETEVTPEVPSDFVYDVQKGDGITHAIFGLAEQIDVCDNLNGADYYAVYEQYEQQLGALANTYDMGNGDFGLSDWNKDFIIDGELRAQIEESLREKAGLATETVASVEEAQATAPAVDLSELGQAIEEGEIEIDTADSSESTTQDTGDTQNISVVPDTTPAPQDIDVATEAFENAVEDISDTINIDVSNIDSEEVIDYVTSGIEDYYREFAASNNFNIRDLSLTDSELVAEIFEEIKTDIAAADLDFDSNIDIFEQLSSNDTLKTAIDEEIREILDNAGAFVTA